MRHHVRIARPEPSLPPIQRRNRFKIVPRAQVRKNIIALPDRDSIAPFPDAPPAQFQIDPYLDYGRFLTAEGGILIIYKDHDLRWRHIIWRVLIWTVFTSFEACYLLNPVPVQSQWPEIAVFLAAAVINWIIVVKPVEIYRRIEIRPDCMIIDGSEVFWAHLFEGGFPSCRRDADGNRVFCGTYGTRFVEFLTIRRFDENDRMPEVMSAHLKDAMRQLWAVPH